MLVRTLLLVRLDALSQPWPLGYATRVVDIALHLRQLAAIVQRATDPLRELARQLLFSDHCFSSPWCTWDRPLTPLAFP